MLRSHNPLLSNQNASDGRSQEHRTGDKRRSGDGIYLPVTRALHALLVALGTVTAFWVVVP